MKPPGQSNALDSQIIGEPFNGPASLFSKGFQPIDEAHMIGSLERF
jgi:hypothetical protein